MGIDRRVFLAQNFDISGLGDRDRCFKPTHPVQYPPICKEFGPVNLSCIVDFIKSLERELASHPDCEIIFCIEKGRKNLTQAVFLLGAYMVLKEQMRPKEVAASFWRVKAEQLEPFCDATHSQPYFKLSLLGCWYGCRQGYGRTGYATRNLLLFGGGPTLHIIGNSTDRPAATCTWLSLARSLRSEGHKISAVAGTWTHAAGCGSSAPPSTPTS